MDYQASVYTTSSADRIASVNKVLRNTYQLLALNVLFAAVMAFVGLQIGFQIGIISLIVFFAGAWFLPNLINKTADSAMGLVWTFVYTGFLGFFLAPIVGRYLHAGMGNVVWQALAATALIFFSLSGYALTTKKDFSFMRSFLVVGSMVLFFACIALTVASFMGYHMPLVSVALSAAICLLVSGVILYQTGEIVNGGETNYIRATATLFASIWSLFVNLLHILGFANDD